MGKLSSTLYSVVAGCLLVAQFVQAESRIPVEEFSTAQWAPVSVANQGIKIELANVIEGDNEFGVIFAKDQHHNERIGFFIAGVSIDESQPVSLLFETDRPIEISTQAVQTRPGSYGLRSLVYPITVVNAFNEARLLKVQYTDMSGRNVTTPFSVDNAYESVTHSRAVFFNNEFGQAIADDLMGVSLKDKKEFECVFRTGLYMVARKFQLTHLSREEAVTRIHQVFKKHYPEITASTLKPDIYNIYAMEDHKVFPFLKNYKQDCLKK